MNYRFAMLPLSVACVAACTRSPTLQPRDEAPRREAKTAIRAQATSIEAARPKFDASVRKKLEVGDTLEHVKRTLTDAGLTFSIHVVPRHMLQSRWEAGRGCGFLVQLDLDHDDRVAKVAIQEFTTVP